MIVPSKVLRVLADVIDGADPRELARALLSLAISLVPVDDLRPMLDDAARARDDAAADAAEAAKLGGFAP